MARDTRTDAPTPLEGYRLIPIMYGDEHRSDMYIIYKGLAYRPEKIEAGKSDVQPMVEENYKPTSFRDTTLDEFDKGIEGLTDRRGDVYGHPADDFHRIIQMQKALVDCDDEFARHIMNMICVKMSRLVKTPDHSDSWLDIVGYVRTWFMIKEKKDE